MCDLLGKMCQHMNKHFSSSFKKTHVTHFVKTDHITGIIFKSLAAQIVGTYFAYLSDTHQSMLYSRWFQHSGDSVRRSKFREKQENVGVC